MPRERNNRHSKGPPGPFKIYIDRLSDDDVEEIFETFDPSLLAMDESELTFMGEITLSGRAYLAKSHLILDLKIKAKTTLPCSICNAPAELQIEIDDFSHTEEIGEIRGAIWDYSEEIRSAILIKVPQFFECHHGHCPHRKDVKKYFKAPSEETNTPFSDLKL